MHRFRVYLSVSVVALASLVLIGSANADSSGRDMPLKNYHFCNAQGEACVTVQ